jgi:hypothetical protein
MAAKKKPTDTPEKQSARFIEAAKKAEADERPEAFDEMLKRVARKRSVPKK